MPVLVIGHESYVVSEEWMQLVERMRASWQFSTSAQVLVRCAVLLDYLQQQEARYGAITSLSYPVGSWQQVHVVPSDDEKNLFLQSAYSIAEESLHSMAANDDRYT